MSTVGQIPDSVGDAAHKSGTSCRRFQTKNVNSVRGANSEAEDGEAGDLLRFNLRDVLRAASMMFRAANVFEPIEGADQ